MLVSGSGRRLISFVIAVALVGTLVAVGSASAAKPTSHQTYGTPGNDEAGGVIATDGLSVDPISGKVVVDDGNGRVSVFSPKGRFLLAFGTDVDPGGGTGPEVCRSSCQEGTDGSGAGELAGILEAEVSPDRRIYVSEQNNRRVSVFTMSGKFLFAFGDDVDPAGLDGPEVCTTVCQQGEAGPFGGSLEQPWASTFGPDGDFYLTNTDNNRVDRYTPDGDHVYGFGKDVNVTGGTGVETCRTDECKLGDAGGGPGSLPRPEGIDFDPQGRIWIGSWDGERLNSFTSEPGFRFGLGVDVIPGGPSVFEKCTTSCQNGVGDSDGDGDIDVVQGVAVEAGKGTVYAADRANNRINAYDPRGRFLRSIGYGVGGGMGLEACRSGCQAGLDMGGTHAPYPVATNCRGTIFVGSNNSGVVEAIGSEKAKPGPCKLKVRKLKVESDGSGKLKALVPYAGRVKLSGRGIRGDKARHEGLEGIEKLEFETKPSVNGKITLKVLMKPSDGNVKQTAKAQLKLP